MHSRLYRVGTVFGQGINNGCHKSKANQCNLCKKDNRKFWKEIKHRTNSKVNKNPMNIEGVDGDVNIGSMWKYLYEHIFNSVKDSRCDIVQFYCVTYNTGMTIGAGELMNIIN